MCQLDSDFLSLGVCKFSDFLKSPLAFDVLIAPDSAVFRGDSSFWDDCRSFNYRESRTTSEDATKMGELPSCEMAILGRILAQRGEEDTILESGSADGQGLEDLWKWLVIWLGIGSCSSWRFLSRCKV